MSEKKDASVRMTREGYDDLKKELETLKTTGRTEVAEKLKIARSYGDLSENSEYDQAKADASRLENQINEIEYKLQHAEIVEKSTAKGKVSYGSVVTVKESAEGKIKRGGKKFVLTIVDSNKANAKEGLISEASPFGAALMDKKKGDIIVVSAPAGKTEYKITDVKND